MYVTWPYLITHWKDLFCHASLVRFVDSILNKCLVPTSWLDLNSVLQYVYIVIYSLHRKKYALVLNLTLKYT